MDENNVTATAGGVAETEPAASETGAVGEPAAPGMDEDAILPEGWKPEDGGETAGGDKPSPEDESLLRLFGLTQDGADSPETQSETETKQESAEPRPDEGAEPPQQDAAPDYKAMYEELLRNAQDAKGRETFRQAYAEQKAAGMSDAAARLVAKDAAGGKEFPLTDEADAPANAGKPDYAAALNQLHSAFPDVKDIPAEVTKAMMDGGDPVAAYMSYQRARDQKTIGELRAKIADMERKAANTVRAVARGVSGNGAKQDADDNFLKGMMDEDW